MECNQAHLLKYSIFIICYFILLLHHILEGFKKKKMFYAKLHLIDNFSYSILCRLLAALESKKHKSIYLIGNQIFKKAEYQIIV